METIQRLELVPINMLVGYARNARTHSPEQIAQLRASLREFGFVNPVLCDKDHTIIAGHGRVEAARAEGVEMVPCVFVEHLTEAQRRAYIIADNRLAENAGWDADMLGIEISDLASESFDLSLLGFDAEELERYTADVENFDTDFQLPSEEKNPFCVMSFSLHEKQAELIRAAIAVVKDSCVETFGNGNGNGNSLYEVVRQWDEQRKSKSG